LRTKAQIAHFNILTFYEDFFEHYLLPLLFHAIALGCSGFFYTFVGLPDIITRLSKQSMEYMTLKCSTKPVFAEMDVQ